MEWKKCKVVKICKNSICSGYILYYKSRAVFGGNSSKSLCWQTFPCFFADSPRDMGTRWWEAALLPCNPRIHLCGIHVHSVFKSTRSGSKSCHWCCQDTQAFLSVGIYLSYCIVSPNQSAFFCSCNPPHAFNAKPLLSEIVIPMAHWCYFYVPAESIDELWQHPVHKGTNISFTGLYEIKLL